nr:MAG TPA: major capsid protein [Caudoviricetes sp.]
MINSLTLKDKREQLKIKAESLLSEAKKEFRKLTTVEETEYNDLCKQIADVDNELRDLNDKLNNKETKTTMKENFSLLKAVRAIANNQTLDERSQEVVNAGIAEMRKSGQSYSGQIVLPVEERADIQATKAGKGQEIVAEDKLNILAPLRDALVLSAAGANFMTGLVGNVSIPTYSGSTVGWAGEVDAASDGAGTFGEVELSPKRLTAYVDISKQFLIQDSVSAEALLRKDIVDALSNKLEATILGAVAGDATKPAGLFAGVTADTAAITFADILKMEQTLEEKNVGGNIKFIASPAAKAVLRTTAVGGTKSDLRMLMEGNEIDGIPTLVTNGMTSKGLILGNFNDLVIGQWGGIDLTVDPYTQAANGKIRLVVNAYFDAKPQRADSFVTKVLK